MGTIINVYRETEASLANYQQILDTPKEVKPAHPKTIEHIETLEFDDVHFQHLTASTPALDGISFRTKAGRNHCLRRAIRLGQNHAREAAGGPLPARRGPDSLQRHPRPRTRPGYPARANRLRDSGHPALRRHHPRKPALRGAPTPPTSSAWKPCTRPRPTPCWPAPRWASIR